MDLGINDYYKKEIFDCCTELAIRSYEQRGNQVYFHGTYTDDFLDYKERITNIVFANIANGDDFSDAFVKYINRTSKKARIKDFYKMLLLYLKEINIMVNASIGFKSDEELKNDLVERIQRIYVEKQQKTNYQDEFSNICKKYLAELSDKKQKGLMPCNKSIMTKRLYDTISSSKIISQKGLLSFVNSHSDSNINTVGCYVIYNTFSEKYYIGKGYHIISDACLYLFENSSNSNQDLFRDVLSGHVFLFKFVSLKNSGYDNVNNLKNVLMQGYNSLKPNGYNDIDYVDI